MRKIIIGFILLFISAFALGAQGGKRNIYVSEELGISMDLPMAKNSEYETAHVASFLLPPSGGFGANVNIQKQQFPGTLAEYDRLSQGQFQSLNLTVIKREELPGELRYEYHGLYQGTPLRWYSRAVKKGDVVFLVTATGLQSLWPSQGPELRRAVDSFQWKQ